MNKRGVVTVLGIVTGLRFQKFDYKAVFTCYVITKQLYVFLLPFSSPTFPSIVPSSLLTSPLLIPCPLHAGSVWLLLGL